MLLVHVEGGREADAPRSYPPTLGIGLTRVDPCWVWHTGVTCPVRIPQSLCTHTWAWVRQVGSADPNPDCSISWGGGGGYKRDVPAGRTRAHYSPALNVKKIIKCFPIETCDDFFQDAGWREAGAARWRHYLHRLDLLRRDLQREHLRPLPEGSRGRRQRCGSGFIESGVSSESGSRVLMTKNWRKKI